jgi:hypothetical protein
MNARSSELFPHARRRSSAAPPLTNNAPHKEWAMLLSMEIFAKSLRTVQQSRAGVKAAAGSLQKARSGAARWYAA